MDLSTDLSGKTAIVTGAGQGMGRAVSNLLASRGANILINDINQVSTEETVRDLRVAGANVDFSIGDVTSKSDVDRMIKTAIDSFGEIHILVNNAGLSGTSADDPLSTEGWHMIMDVNATGVFLGTKTVAELMKDQGGGSIVNISSIMGFVGGEYGHPAYHASKGAVRIFSKAMAVKYGPHGVRVNSVHPGFMPPMSSANHATDGARDSYILQTPLRRSGKSIEAAYGVLFLASDESSYMTGSELTIDGGITAM